MSYELIEQTNSDSARLRRKAQTLLARLLELREQSLQRLAERGLSDPLERITGRSAYDSAIDSTKQMIRRLNDVEEYSSDSNDVEADLEAAVVRFYDSPAHGANVPAAVSVPT